MMTTMSPVPARKAWLHPLLAALVVVLVQTAVLGSMIASRAAVLRSGEEIVLKTAPVDPRDLLRGDYVVLSYDIATISSDRIVGTAPDHTEALRLSVRLAPGADGFWAVSEVSFDPLAKRAGSVVLRTQPFVWYPPPPGSTATYVVTYGIERYYVPEGEGRVLEEARNAENLTVTARVSESGTAQIASIAIDGKQVYEEPLY